jgi:hypothetical protein
MVFSCALQTARARTTIDPFVGAGGMSTGIDWRVVAAESRKTGAIF